MPIPNLTTKGDHGELPPGEHLATIAEVEKEFGKSTNRRILLMSGLRKAIDEFRKAGVKRIYLDGSFVTGKDEPEDIDGCWSIEGLEQANLDKMDSDFWNHPTPLAARECQKRIKAKYYLDFYFAEMIEAGSMKPFPKFFQVNRVGDPKGIIRIDL